MNTVYLIRDKQNKQATQGTLIAGNKSFYVLENPWLDNRNNVSCIPRGTYKVHHLKRSSSGRYKDVYWVRGVNGRRGILIHAGNITKHTKGCLLIGKRRGFLGGLPAVLASRTALKTFVNHMGRKPFTLKVMGGQ